MNRFNAIIKWVETRLDEGGWVRRGFLVFSGVMLYQAQQWAFAFATGAPVRFTGTDIAAIVAAATVPASIVAKFAFDAYLESRKRPSGTITRESTTDSLTVEGAK